MGHREYTMAAVVLAAALSLASICTEPAAAADKPAAPQPAQGAADKGPRAVIKTKFGEMEIKFFPEAAPKHVENFLKLAKSGFYNGTIFHRVIPGFMIQGGDPNTKDPSKKEVYGMGGPGYSVKAEFNEIPHKRGIVSMARSQDPDSAGSQFFIVVEDSPFLNHKYTVFGEVVKGIGVADKIVNQPRDAKDNPLERIEMTVTVTE
jgi:peptidyl-prolyl cis-trans isomerase B (cyclophilin B)